MELWPAPPSLADRSPFFCTTFHAKDAGHVTWLGEKSLSGISSASWAFIKQAFGIQGGHKARSFLLVSLSGSSEDWSHPRSAERCVSKFEFYTDETCSPDDSIRSGLIKSASRSASAPSKGPHETYEDCPLLSPRFRGLVL